MGRFLSRLAKVFLWGFGVLTVAMVAGGLGVLSVVYSMVYFGDDSSLKKATIIARINEETNIYMLDGETQIGSIFADAHRRYVPIDEVPAHMINALIAAEDKNYYSHHGIDPVAVASALAGKLKGGRMRGASTLTQQTARNILGWWDVTLSRKIKEAVAALQLERLYSKRQILEFYLNQFHVSGNGRGIGIAARYYFNKDVKDLDLVEAAFVAGSVKGPSQYDPFIKYTRERRERAIKLAYHRKNYVLRRMYEQGWISKEEFKDAWDKPVKFNRGTFRSDEVALVHVIQQQLARKEILDALGIDDPRDLAAAGLKIFTTIDGELQRAGQIAVRRNLARLETILGGFKEESAELFMKRRTLVPNDFYFGKVAAIEDQGGKSAEPSIRLNFGLPSCTIPYESLMRYAKWVDLPFGRGWQKVLTDMLKQIKVGETLYAEVLSYDDPKHEGVCDLMKRPFVNGGLIALDKGEVRAVVSGFDTHGFNRSLQARRQPGSVFKPVVYFAALQLGWSILDRLDNERQMFPFQGRFYYPHPDHDSPYKEVSMIWAGTMSENCASVSLTSHLLDKLNLDQFKQLLGVMDLLPHAGEAPRDFHFRVARAMGVQLENEGVREFQLTNAVNDLLLDMQFASGSELGQRLRKMWWGRGYAHEMQTIMLSRDDLSANQRAMKLRLAANNFTRMQALAGLLSQDWKTLAAAASSKGAEGVMSDPGLTKILDRFRVLPGLSKPGLGYAAVLDGERPDKDYKYSSDIEKLIAPPGRPLGGLDVQAIWGGNSLFGSADVNLGDVMLDGWLPYGQEQTLAQYVDKHYAEVMSRNEEFDLNRYFQHHDFRLAVGLNYLVSLARAMGVTSPMEPVLSFPLGTNVVTLAEVAKIYQTFVSGKTYRYYKEGPPNQLNFIRKIEDRYGNTIYEPKRAEYQLVQHEFGIQMREILRRVFTHGTGRSGRSELYVTLGGGDKNAKPDKYGKLPGEKRILIPAFGKTGTTNNYHNANFAGFLPYPTGKGQPLDPDNSYVLAAYTGFDLTKPMQRGAIRVTGAIGALPAWVGLAKAIIEKKHFIDQVDTLDLSVLAQSEWPVKAEAKATTLPVDLPRGVILGGVGAGGGDAGASTTNVSKEGESRFDEFRASSVEAAVKLPLNGGAPLRLFSPYRLEDQLKAGGLKAAAGQPGRDEPPLKDVRYYDQDGNRVDGPAPTPGATGAAAPAPGTPAAASTPAGEPQATGPAAPVDPMAILEDIGNPDQGSGGDSSTSKDQKESVGDSELW